MNAANLQKALSVTPATLRAWIKAGLPCKGKGRDRVFEPAAVEQWLLDTGRAEKPAAPSPAGVVACTMAEAALLLGVSKRVFADWATEPAFPGKPGTTGKRDGYFPIAEIEAWRASRFGADARSGAADDGERAVRRQMLEIDRDRKLAELERDVLGTLIDAEETTRFIAFVVATAKGVLQELPDRVLARLPGKLPMKLRKLIRKVVLTVVRETLEHLTQLVKGDDDAKGDDA
jgi:predicted DNA-binding transcriptional regulator AlpA